VATFITTIQFTEQGIKSIKDSPKRATAFRAAAKKLGVKVTSLYWTLGPFDGCITCDAPDEATVTALMLHLSSQGNVKTTTAQAFDAAEMEKVVGMLGN
jgi:uncharacterized protein with GYD domain